MITIPVSRAALADLVALDHCPDCLGSAVLVADQVDAVGIVRGVRAALAHSADSCPGVQALPLGTVYLVLPPEVGP